MKLPIVLIGSNSDDVDARFVFLQHVKLPFLEHYDEPESYGLAREHTKSA